MNKLLKNMKKVVSIMLVMSMIFTSHAFVTFAEGVDNVETTIEETTVEADNEIVGANSVSPEEDTEETTTETTAAEEEAGSVDEDTEETTVGANSVSPENEEEEPIETTDYAEEPEEDTKEIETTIEEIEETTAAEEQTEQTEATEETTTSEEETTATEEIKVDTVTEANIENIIYGAGSRKFILVGVNSSDEVTAYTVDETTSKETWKAGISSSGIVDYDVNIGTYYRLASGTNLDVDDVKSQYEKYKDEEFRSFTWLENEFDTWKTGSEDKAIGYSYGASAPKYFNVLYINKSSNKTSYEILSGMDAVLLDFKIEELFTLMSDDLKGWHVFTPDDPTDPSSVIENYNPDYSGTAEYAGTKEGLKQAYNDWNNNPTDNMFIGAMFEGSTTYTVKYNQDLPTGYTLSGGMTWYTDSTTTDLTGSPIILKGSADMTCEDTSGNTRTLQSWNTQIEHKGNTFNFGDTFNDPSYFESDPTCTLYAMWSDPVAPTTGFMYWKVDGDDTNKTIHYYATPGEGRTAVTIGTDGIEYTGLETSEKEKIKKAVIEEPIVAIDVRKLFSYFKGLVSITNLGNLDTSNATSFKSMFEHCEAIEKIETSGLETDSLTDTSYMFTYCTSATDIILDDNFDTSNVTSMREMFNTTGAKELDLTKFDTSNVTDMYGMFSSCENLETIKVSDKFVVDKVSTSNGKFMFANCDKLVGEKGTKIADLSSPYGVTYAHIDEGSTNPGLFSSASTPTTTYTVQYNQNLPAGYTLSGGMTWYTDSTTTDLTGSPITLKGSADMTCEDTSGNTRTLQGWNTQIELKGNTFNFGDTFNDPLYFESDPTCTLYAMWSDPVGPTPTTYTIKYDKNLPSGYTISTSKTWYTDSTSDDLSSNPIKISGSAGMTCENADGYVRKLEAWNTLADKSGTPYMFAENISSPAAFTSNPLTLYAVWGDPVVPTPGTDKFYIISYGNPTEYPNEKKIFAFDSTTTVEEMENFVANNISKCINPSGKAANGFYDMSELIPVGADDTQVRQILNDNYDLTKEKIRTLDKIAVWFEDYIPDPMGVYLGITFEGSTPAKTVTKIAIKTNPTKTTYDSGDAFDPTGLVIKVTYSDSSTEDIDYATHASDFSFNPTTITKSGNVVVTYSGKTANVAVKVNGGPTPPGPTPPSPGGGGTGGGTGGGSSDPAHGPMGDLTKELQQQQQKATDKKQAKKVENDELADLLKSYNENHDAPMVNARDDNGNVGFGQWLRIPGSTIWYFLTSDFNQNVTTVNSNAAPNPTQTANQNKTEGFLVDGWFNLGWDGVDRWYRFNENGIMLMGWWIEDGKTYFLQTDENDNWYGKAMTGTQVIDGVTYNFDENGVLIQ